MPFMYVPDAPQMMPFPTSVGKEPHPDNMAAALKLLDKLEKRKAKQDKEKDEGKKKKNTKERWLPNPDFDDKPWTFSIGEMTAIVMIAAFPISWGQIILFHYIESLLVGH